MKIGIISDIHGNYEALKSVLSYMDNLNISEIYSLGDVAGYYTQINECCNELLERRIPNIMGNHDWYLTKGKECPRSSFANECLQYQRATITKKNLHWLDGSHIKRHVGGIQMVHGGWKDPIDEYLRKPTAEYFSGIPGNIFISGHTHVQGLYEFGDKIYCNPGSVGQPRDGNPKAAFAILEGDKITLHRIKYDIEKVCRLMQLAGFDDRLNRRLRTGTNSNNLLKSFLLKFGIVRKILH